MSKNRRTLVGRGINSIESPVKKRRLRFAAVMAAGLALLPSCDKVEKVHEKHSGALVDGERNSRYRFKVKTGDILFENLRIDGRSSGVSVIQRVSIDRIDAAGVTIKHKWKGYEPGNLTAKGKVGFEGDGRITIPFKKCSMFVGDGYIVRFDDVKGDTYVTMIEKHVLGDMKSFTSKSKPCAP